MADDDTETTENDDTNDDTAKKERSAGVQVPALALAALVVVAALVCGGVGYAIGHSGEDSINLQSPIADVRAAPGDQGEQGRDTGQVCIPVGQRGGGPGGPGGPIGPGGPGQRFDPRGDDQGDQNQGDQNQQQDQNQDDQNDNQQNQDDQNSSI